MYVIVDGKDAHGLEGGAPALLRFLADLEAGGRTVLEVRINGVPLAGPWPEALEEVHGLEAAEVAVVTASATQLLAEAVSEALGYLPRLERGLLAAAEEMRAGREAEAALLLGQAAEGLEWLVEVLRAAAVMVAGGGAGAVERLSNISKRLQEVLGAWEAKDLTLVADLLEYDLAPLVRDAWAAMPAIAAALQNRC